MIGRLDASVCNYSGVTEQNALESWDRFSFHDWLIKLNQADSIMEQSRSVIKFALEKHWANIIFKRYGFTLCQINRVPSTEKYPSSTPVYGHIVPISPLPSKLHISIQQSRYKEMFSMIWPHHLLQTYLPLFPSCRTAAVFMWIKKRCSFLQLDTLLNQGTWLGKQNVGLCFILHLSPQSIQYPCAVNNLKKYMQEPLPTTIQTLNDGTIISISHSDTVSQLPLKLMPLCIGPFRNHPFLTVAKIQNNLSVCRWTNG